MDRCPSESSLLNSSSSPYRSARNSIASVWFAITTLRRIVSSISHTGGFQKLYHVEAPGPDREWHEEIVELDEHASKAINKVKGDQKSDKGSEIFTSAPLATSFIRSHTFIMASRLKNNTVVVTVRIHRKERDPCVRVVTSPPSSTWFIPKPHRTGVALTQILECMRKVELSSDVTSARNKSNKAKQVINYRSERKSFQAINISYDELLGPLLDSSSNSLERRSRPVIDRRLLE
ncbi:hypothetical protein Fmac_001696 [Flemingia macrophylla]|uniref:Uncharacterized protein n=1 Tax=Flemingia macrophylla TaxID=520843 RepID=A0ABD1NHU5_9FABA